MDSSVPTSYANVESFFFQKYMNLKFKLGSRSLSAKNIIAITVCTVYKIEQLKSCFSFS